MTPQHDLEGRAVRQHAQRTVPMLARSWFGRLGVATLLAAALCLDSTTALAGKVDRASKAARGNSSSSKSEASSGSGRARTMSDDELRLWWTVVTLPWRLPYAVVENDRERGSWQRVGFETYPYANRSHGHLKEDDPGVAIQLSADTGFDLGGNVWRHGAGLRVQLPLRLDLATDWSLFREYTNAEVDSLILGRESLALRFAEGETIQFRTGLGPRHLHDDDGWVHGVDLFYGFDLFPGRPLVLSAEGSVGAIGEAVAPGVRASLGVMLGRFELTAGWDQRWIGRVPLGGPALGVRLWL